MSEFGKAFRAARTAGKKTFKWNGKLYTTKLREEANVSTTGTLPKNAPVPAQRPSTAAAATTSDSRAKNATVATSSRPASNSDMAAGKAAERTTYSSPTEMDKRRAYRAGETGVPKARLDERFTPPRVLTEMDKRRIARSGAFLRISTNR